jgi:hypothetical protein
MVAADPNMSCGVDDRAALRVYGRMHARERRHHVLQSCSAVRVAVETATLQSGRVRGSLSSHVRP